ncbi:phospholipid phosphatase-related protein type 4 isoform X2 [Brachyhypopomus gauderio]|uniref:phospholipid phosphatase-related protein type 4 isoform X2 n=1 Tax=Brachyhypopomus gauderio TaxID=698409 RepID=UPI004041371C
MRSYPSSCSSACRSQHLPSRTPSGHGAEADINAAGCNFNSYVRRAVRFVGVHVFGLCATALITDIIQLSTGYPAPYFLTVCKPNYTHLNTSCDENAFILDDICSGPDVAIIRAGRKSFPSQHATLASFAAVYISMYFNSILTDSSKLLKPLLIFSFIISAIICGLTRIIQHKNHAIDVYLGFLLGGSIAVYLALNAVGNFQPSEEKRGGREPPSRDPLRPLADLGQRRSHHLPAKSRSSSSSEGPSSSRPDGVLHRGAPTRHSSSLSNLKRSSADVEMISPKAKENMVTFSHTLPRIHSSAGDEDALCCATVHSTLDSNRSKQLLSQWKSKTESRRLSLHAMERGSAQLEAQSSSELSAMGINGERHGLKLTSTTLPSNPSGIAGGTRIVVQSRPGSSQLVHIPEEAQECISTSPGGTVQGSWLKSMEKGTAPPIRTNGNGQPRVMQVIAMSKQQGLLPTGSPSSESSSHTSSTAPLHRYKSLTEEPGPGAAGQGSMGAIVRVEAHPENGRPLVHAHSTDGGGTWTWKSQSNFRQSVELNDLNRDTESTELVQDGYGTADRTRGNSAAPVSAAVQTLPTISAVSSVPNTVQDHHPHQAISTIRVTPLESSENGPRSRDSTLCRKSNMILIPERGNSPDNTRNIFYKGTSSTPTFKE